MALAAAAHRQTRLTSFSAAAAVSFAAVHAAAAASAAHFVVTSCVHASMRGSAMSRRACHQGTSGSTHIPTWPLCARVHDATPDGAEPAGIFDTLHGCDPSTRARACHVLAGIQLFDSMLVRWRVHEVRGAVAWQTATRAPLAAFACSTFDFWSASFVSACSGCTGTTQTHQRGACPPPPIHTRARRGNASLLCVP